MSFSIYRIQQSNCNDIKSHASSQTLPQSPWPPSSCFCLIMLIFFQTDTTLKWIKVQIWMRRYSIVWLHGDFWLSYSSIPAIAWCMLNSWFRICKVISTSLFSALQSLHSPLSWSILSWGVSFGFCRSWLLDRHTLLLIIWAATLRPLPGRRRHP